MEPIPTSDDLVAIFENGRLASEMARRFGLRDEEAIRAVEDQCIALHNTGAIDLLRLCDVDALPALDDRYFFSAVHIFCDLLPDLEATPSRMIECVDTLVTRGGNDLAANQPNAAFRLWCAKEPERARQIIALAWTGGVLSSRYLTFALESSNEIEESRDFVLSDNDIARVSAITALSRISDEEPKSRAKTLAVFDKLIEREVSDEVQAGLLYATASIIAKDAGEPSASTYTLLRRLVEKPGDFTLHQAADVLCTFSEALTPDVVEILLNVLMHINPENKGTVNRLDYGLHLLLNGKHSDAAIAYVTELLSRPDGVLKLNDFDVFSNTLFSGPIARISSVVVHWLMLGQASLCDGLANAIHSKEIEGAPLDLLAEHIPISPVAQLFLCRKALGWFFVKSITAASVLVSVLRVCEAETAVSVKSLLIDPLLVNYQNIRCFLEGLSSDDPAKIRVNEALSENDKYLKSLQEIPLIKELQPSEHQRRVQWVRSSEQMRRIRKEAEKQSVLLSLVHRSVLLYGRRSLSFHRGDDGEMHPFDMELRPYGVSFEMPRMESFDPVGLDIMLRIFRIERMPQ